MQDYYPKDETVRDSPSPLRRACSCRRASGTSTKWTTPARFCPPRSGRRSPRALAQPESLLRSAHPEQPPRQQHLHPLRIHGSLREQQHGLRLRRLQSPRGLPRRTQRRLCVGARRRQRELSRACGLRGLWRHARALHAFQRTARRRLATLRPPTRRFRYG